VTNIEYFVFGRLEVPAEISTCQTQFSGRYAEIRSAYIISTGNRYQAGSSSTCLG